MVEIIPLTSDKIVEIANKVTSAQQLTRKGNTATIKRAAAIYNFLIQQGSEACLLDITRKIITCNRLTVNTTLDALAAGDTITVEDRKTIRKEDHNGPANHSGKHHSITQKGRETSEFLNKRFETFSDYEEVFGTPIQ